MVRLKRCKKCGTLLSSINKVVNYGDHGWKFTCCKTDYYMCNRDTCNHEKKDFRFFFYLYPQHLDKHIEEFHIKEEEEEDMTNISISLDDYISNRIASTSYVESSSLETYFKENYCIESNSFSHEY